MADEQIVKLGVEATGLETAAAFKTTFSSIKDALESAGLVTEKFNKKSGDLKQTFVGVTAEGQRITLVIKEVDGGFQLLTRTVDANINVIEKANDKYRSFSEKRQEQIAKIAKAEAVAAQNRQERDESYVARTEARDQRRAASGIDAAQRQQIRDEDFIAKRDARDQKADAAKAAAQAKQQTRDEDFAARQQARDEKTLQRSLDLTSKVSRADFAKTEGIGAADLVRNTFPAPTNATLAQLNSYEAKLRSIQTLVASGKVSPLDVSKFSDLTAKGQAINLQGATPAQSQLALTLAGIKEITKGTNEAAAAWDRFTSIVSRLIIRQAVFALVGSIRQGVQEFIALEVKLSEVKVAADGAGVRFGNLSETIRNLSNNTGFKQIDLANAQIAILRQRTTDADSASKLLATSTRLATAGFTTVDKAATSLVEVLNAYGKSNTDAESTSALLFRTSQLGKSSIDEVAGSLVKLAPDSQVAGLSLKETAGFLAAMADKGQSASQASNVLTSAVSALTKPSKELQDVYKQLGIFTGEQLISTFGFVGALEKLNGAVDGNVSKLSGLLGGIKGIETIVGPTGVGFKNLQDRINEVSNATGRFNSSIDTVNSGSGKQLSKQVEEIKNHFIDLGSSIVGTTNNIAGSFGGVVGVVTKLSDTFLFVTTAYVGYRLSAILASAANTAFATTAELAGAKSAFLGIQLEKAQAGFAGFAKAASLVALAGFGGFELGNLLFEHGDIKTLTEGAEASDAKVRKLQEQSTKSDQEQSKQRVQNQIDESDKKIQTIQQEAAKRTAILLQITEAEKQQARDVSETLKLSVEAVVDRQRQRLADLNRLTGEARNQLKQAEDFIAKGGAKSKEQLFTRELGTESDPTRQIDLVERRLKELDASRTKLRSTGSVEDLKAARELDSQIEALLNKREQSDIERQKQRAAAGLAPDRIESRINLTTGKEEQVLRISFVESERLRNEEIKKRISLEKQSADLLKQQIADNERKAVAQKVSFTSIEDAQRRLTSFSLTDQQGNLRKDIAGATPQDKITSALAVFDKQVDAFKEKVGSKAFEGIAEEVAAKRADIAKEASRLILIEEQRLATGRLTLTQQRTKEEIAALQKAVPEAESSKKNAAQGVIDTTNKVLANIRATTPADIFGFGVKGGNTEDINALLDTVASRALSLRSTAIRIKEGETGPGVLATAEDQRKQLEVFLNALQSRAAQAPTSDLGRRFGASFTPATEQTNAVGFQTTINSLKTGLDALNEAETRRHDLVVQLSQKANIELPEAGRQLSLIIEKFGAAPIQINGLIQENLGANAQQTIADASVKLSNLTFEIDRLKKTADLQAPKPTDLSGQGGPVVPGLSKGGLVMRFAEGGFVPKGTDTVPAMLTPGEYVLDAGTTKKFFPIIRALHQGFLPPTQHLASGGPVVNVGDINVTVSGGKASEASAREIAVALRREIRRGTLTLE